ncbi:hypothetical protein OIO90_004579 [Microbotryomycetes sp. JL221]|nr:hypothetical protein OIO90_004579 [Microbotryomycetes sp. JL221]
MPFFNATPTVLDYVSDCPTFALSFSPLSTSTSSLKLAIGSYSETRGAQDNNLTIATVDPTILDLQDDDEDDDDDINVDDNDDMHSPTSTSITKPLEFRDNNRFKTQDGTKRRLSSAFHNVARATHVYPPSNVEFSPAKLSQTLQSSTMSSNGDVTREMVATSSECLRLWDVVEDTDNIKGRYVGQNEGDVMIGHKLVLRAALANSKAEYSAPLTSFSWSAVEPTHIVTSSIDTTCTVWDISNGTPVTQLIAHDREVYDVAWSPSSKDIFASVGADGSVRMFDLRSLEHSTILYEATNVSVPVVNGSSSSVNKSNNNNGLSPTSPNPNTTTTTTTTNPSPLLRLGFCPTNSCYLSVCHADSNQVSILDIRNPGTPVVEVKGHQAAVNGIAWGVGATMSGTGSDAGGSGWLATCSDDCTLLLWDLSTTLTGSTNTSSTSSSGKTQPYQTKIVSTPSMSYSAPSEINSVAWGGEWVAVGCGRVVRCLKI